MRLIDVDKFQELMLITGSVCPNCFEKDTGPCLCKFDHIKQALKLSSVKGAFPHCGADMRGECDEQQMRQARDV